MKKTLRVLHTADWHLGQRFVQQEREQEFGLFLAWLLETMKAERVEVLLLAGDVFDTGTPPYAAQQQYYDFLRQVRDTGCRHVVIIGGNHDSPIQLNAPGALLRLLDVHVIGCAERIQGEWQPAREVVELCDAQGRQEAVIAAVPYLRDRDLRFALPGEQEEVRAKILRQSIARHYEVVCELAAALRQPDVPLIGMGHLFAAGGQVSDSELDIHLGHLGQTGVEAFPQTLSYVALGHLHRPQIVAGQTHIRYSGSPVALSFSERSHAKEVLLLDWQGDALAAITPIQIPVFRRLLRLKGALEEVRQAIAQLRVTPGELTAWAEVELTDQMPLPSQVELLHQQALTQNLVLLRIFTSARREVAGEIENYIPDLQELAPKDVFLRRCQAAGKDEAQTANLLSTFDELQRWIREQH